MNRKLYYQIITFLLAMIFLPMTCSVRGEGILPSLTDTVGIAMPSLGEALGRYPDSETDNADGSVTELYTNISESDFNTFSIYLEQQEAELVDYSVKNGILTAEIRVKGASFNLEYESKSGEAKVTYPAGTFDERTKNAEVHFDAAQKLLAEGKTDEAYAEIFAIPQFTSYGPVDSLMKNDEELAAAAACETKRALFKKVGNIVTFGTYPQTASGTDNTPIEWIVLDYDETNHKALLLSYYGLDAKPYNTEKSDNTWKGCTLRAWLNNDFLKKAFSAEEQSAILTTLVDNSASQGFDWEKVFGGVDKITDKENTQDKLFLLSYVEANQYPGVTWGSNHNPLSRVAPTEYAIKNGATTSDKYETEEGKPTGECWWLRSPGLFRDHVARVTDSGALDSRNVLYSYGIVRPALWLNLESEIF